MAFAFAIPSRSLSGGNPCPVALVRIGSSHFSPLFYSLVSTSICLLCVVASEVTVCVEDCSGSRCVAMCETRVLVLSVVTVVSRGRVVPCGFGSRCLDRGLPS
eukprot:11201948-Lingulodinium_polyedra.AAC.1